jgi:hypothetical protein
VIGAAIMVGKIATGEMEDIPARSPNRAKGGKIGGERRAPTVYSLFKQLGVIN